MKTAIKTKLLNTWNYGQTGTILNCSKEDGEFYYTVLVKKTNGRQERIMLHESQLIIL